MQKYKKIHIWEFPPTLTFVRLNNRFRLNFFNKLIRKVGSRQKLLNLINKASLKYDIKRNHSPLNLYSWIKGQKFDRGKNRTINIPLWVLIESSKILSNNKYKEIIHRIEKNIEYYTSWGNANPVKKTKLPLYLTPEMVSVIFHFLGDGHLGKKRVTASYRQMNKQGLNNFLQKLKNIFGDFNYSKSEFKDGRLNIPKIIADFYKYYFKLPNTNTFEAFVPNNIKNLDKEFLIAGLAAFIVDEAHIKEVITIYSKNKKLITDIRDIAIKLNYLSFPISKKYAYGKFDCYRFNISSKSFKKFYLDLQKLSAKFSTCTLVQKQDRLINRIQTISSV